MKFVWYLLQVSVFGGTWWVAFHSFLNDPLYTGEPTGPALVIAFAVTVVFATASLWLSMWLRTLWGRRDGKPRIGSDAGGKDSPNKRVARGATSGSESHLGNARNRTLTRK